MNIHKSAEDYLESILVLEKRQGSVRSVDIANYLEFSKPSVSIAMKRLRENGYVEVDGSGRISLTDEGLAIAEQVYRRHRVISGMLIAMGVEEVTALKDACRIEHVLSQETFERICQHWGTYTQEA